VADTFLQDGYNSANLRFPHNYIVSIRRYLDQSGLIIKRILWDEKGFGLMEANIVGYLVILNNYLHDVATAMVISLTVLMLYISGLAGQDSTKETRRLVSGIYRYFARWAGITLAWIIIGGIPRVLAFRKYELIPAQEKGIVNLLVFKHLIPLAWWRGE